jgi:hypothetical protein
VFAYLAATIACGRVWAADRQSVRRGLPGSPVFWLVLTLLLLLLGINKQLDFQTLLNDVGRRMAKAQGWYGVRRFYQVIFIGTVTALGLISLGGFSWLARREWKRNFVALLGTVFLYVFVLTRASSIHHVDVMLQWRVLGMKWNWILELGGIFVTLVGALMASRLLGPSTPQGALRFTEGPDDEIGPRRYSIRRGIVISHPQRKRRFFKWGR